MSVPPMAPFGSDQSGRGLRRAVVKGSAWTGAQNLAVRLLSLLTFVVLARLLTPHDYGIAAIAGVFSALVAPLAAGGFTAALVQKEHLREEDVDSVFWVGLAIGCTLSVALAALAPAIAWWLDEPELRLVLLVLSPMFLAIALGSAQAGMLQRSFRFSTFAKITVSGNLVATLVGVVLAFEGAGYWALVAQMMFPIFWCTAGYWLASDYRPAWRFSRHRFTALFRSSRQFVGDGLVTVLAEQSDKFIIGSRLGTSTLGVYAVAYRVVYILLDVLWRSMQLVALPAFARLQASPARLHEGYLSALRTCAALTLPCFALVATTAGESVVTVFGARWSEASDALVVLAVFGAVQCFVGLNAVLLQATGRVQVAFRLNLLVTVAQLLALPLAVRYGVTWVAAVLVVRALAHLMITTVAIGRGRSRALLTDTLGCVLPPALGTLGLAVCVLGLARLTPLESWAFLGAAGTLGLGTYLGLLRVLSRRHWSELREIVGQLRATSR